MAVNEQIVTGRKLRKLVDEATKLWQRISFWTKAVDVEFNDSKTAETKLGAIDGITDSLASTSSRIAASAKALNQVNNNLTSQLPGGVKILAEGSGADVKYYAQLGADAASKKLLGNAKIKAAYTAKDAPSYTLTADTGYKFITAFVSRYDSPAQHAFWSDEFEVAYTDKQLLSMSSDHKSIIASNLQSSHSYYLCGVEVPD